MFGNKKEKRFKVLHEEGALFAISIIQDRETGVNYLFSSYGSGGGITPLLDSDGNVVVTPIED